MAERKSIFSDDWRESLRVHYIDVVRRNDTNTEKTLTGVMYEVGFREDELRELKLRATMRAEDLHEDFVPTLELPEDDTPVFAGVDVEPDVVPTEDELEPTDERYIAAELVEEASETEPDSEQVEEASPDDNPPTEDGDLPQQMSMF